MCTSSMPEMDLEVNMKGKVRNTDCQQWSCRELAFLLDDMHCLSAQGKGVIPWLSGIKTKKNGGCIRCHCPWEIHSPAREREKAMSLNTMGWAVIYCRNRAYGHTASRHFLSRPPRDTLDVAIACWGKKKCVYVTTWKWIHHDSSINKTSFAIKIVITTVKWGKVCNLGSGKHTLHARQDFLTIMAQGSNWENEEKGGKRSTLGTQLLTN